jgi:hypothetical protein
MFSPMQSIAFPPLGFARVAEVPDNLDRFSNSKHPFNLIITKGILILLNLHINNDFVNNNMEINGEKVFSVFSLKGDAHKIYLQIKGTLQMGQSIHSLNDFKEIEAIQGLYQSLDSPALKLVYYRMVKEKNGSGIIPILVTSIPWLCFYFRSRL